MAPRYLAAAALAGVLALSGGQGMAQSAPPPPLPASPPPPAAQQSSLAGQWDMAIDGVAVFRFEIRQDAAGEWSGTWSRPNRFNTDGNSFANMGGGVKTTPSMTGILYAGAVELSFDDPRPGAVPDIFRFRQIDADTAEMTYVGTDLAPYRMVRAGAGAAFGAWPQGRVLRRAVPGQQAPQPRPPAASPPPATPARPLAPVTLPAPVTVGPRINFLDLTPRTPPPAAEEDAAGASEPAAQDAPPVTVDEDFLEGL